MAEVDVERVQPPNPICQDPSVNEALEGMSYGKLYRNGMPGNETTPSLPFRMSFLGQSGAGKSFRFSNTLVNDGVFDSVDYGKCIWVGPPGFDRNRYVVMMEMGATMFVEWKEFASYGVDFWRQLCSNARTHVILAFDDIPVSQFESVLEYFRTFRHVNTSCVCLSQTFTGANLLGIRNQCSIFCFMPGVKSRDIKTLTGLKVKEGFSNCTINTRQYNDEGVVKAYIESSAEQDKREDMFKQFMSAF